MIRRLRQTERKDLLSIGCTFAVLRFEQESDKQWLREVIIRMKDDLEDNWFLQEWVDKGLEEGSLRELRGILLRITTRRFPGLVSQAQKQVEQVKSQEQLRTMIDLLVTANTDQEARAALMG